MPGGFRSVLAALETRYGRRGALAVGLATAALVVVPVPGIVFLPVGLAELLLKAKGRTPAAAVSVMSKD